MALTPADGLLFKKDEKLGRDQLQWQAREYEETYFRQLFGRLAQPGLVLWRKFGGVFGDAWRVLDGDDDGSLSLTYAADPMSPSAPNVWLDAIGRPVFLTETQANVLALPNDATWYTIVAERETTEYERGTLAVTTGSKVVTGTGTEFHRYGGKTTDGAPGTFIRIDAGDSADGNAGTYEIDVVTSNTSITLVDAVNGTTESGIPFHVTSNYFGTPPADPDIHQRSVPVLKKIARSRVPGNAAQVILADAKRDDGGSPKVQIIDRREANVARRLQEEPRQTWFVPNSQFSTDGGGSPLVQSALRFSVIGGGSSILTNAGYISAAPASAPGEMVVAVADATPGLACVRLETSFPEAHDPLTAVDVIDAAVTTPPAIAYLPSVLPGSAGSHVVVYEKTNKVYKRTSADDGVTWSGETMIWDPTAVAAGDRVSHPMLLLLRCGRLVMVADYLDSASGDYRLRYIRSDDYGATWSTNTNAGFAVYTPSAGFSATKPYAAQGPSGEIMVVCQFWSTASSESDSVLVYGISDNELQPVMNTVFPRITMPATAVTNQLLDPVVYASDDGSFVLMATVRFLAGPRGVAQWSVARFQDTTFSTVTAEVSAGQMMWVTDSTAPVESLSLEICQATGQVIAFYREVSDANPRVAGVALTPVSMPLSRPRLQR